MRRETELFGVFRMRYAIEVHHLHMHAQERLKSNRSVIRAHAVTIAARPPLALRRLLLLLPLRRFPGQVPQIFCTFGRIANVALTASSLSSRDHVSGNSAPLPMRFDSRATCADQNELLAFLRNDAMPSEILQSNRRTGEFDNEISGRCAGLGRLGGTGIDGEIKRTAVRWLPSVAKVCLHIGFCKFWRRQNGAAQRVHVPPSELSR